MGLVIILFLCIITSAFRHGFVRGEERPSGKLVNRSAQSQLPGHGSTDERTSSSWPPPPVLDPRYIASGTHSTIMLQRSYLDQPYCVVASTSGGGDNDWTGQDVERFEELNSHNQRHVDRSHDGVKKEADEVIPRWVCVITADNFHEGGSGEQIMSLFSNDYGKTWSQPVTLEPNISLANAYSTIAINTFGRIYAMYNFNADNITELPDGKHLPRQDELGHFVMKYSDDRGESWSEQRYEIPYRESSIDIGNSWHGKVRMMWSVDQSNTVIDTATQTQTLYYAFTKIGQYAYSPPEEIWFLASDNIMTERDASKVIWKLLPDGDHGLAPPGGNPNIAEEGHIMPLPNGQFYAVFRTTQGFLAACNTPGPTASKWNNCTNYFAQYERSLTAQPHFLKNPRGPITMKHFSNGRYLMLYYNNGNTGFSDTVLRVAASADNSRNPYWLTAGMATEDGVILWSQPEIIIYDRIPSRPGYPDFLEIPSTGQIFITETQKTIARIHEVNELLLEKLWMQHNSTVIAKDFAAKYEKSEASAQVMEMASLPTFGNYTREDGLLQGFTFILWLAPLKATDDDVLLTAYEHDYHKGLDIVWKNKTINFTTSDNSVLASCSTDTTCSSRLQSTQDQHQLAVTVDNGPFMITLAVDGVLCDGGPDRARGSCWMDNQLRDVNGLANATVGQYVNEVLLYNRALFNSEVVADYNNRFMNDEKLQQQERSIAG